MGVRAAARTVELIPLERGRVRPFVGSPRDPRVRPARERRQDQRAGRTRDRPAKCPAGVQAAHGRRPQPREHDRHQQQALHPPAAAGRVGHARERERDGDREPAQAPCGGPGSGGPEEQQRHHRGGGDEQHQDRQPGPVRGAEIRPVPRAQRPEPAFNVARQRAPVPGHEQVHRYPDGEQPQLDPDQRRQQGNGAPRRPSPRTLLLLGLHPAHRSQSERERRSARGGGSGDGEGDAHGRVVEQPLVGERGQRRDGEEHDQAHPQRPQRLVGVRQVNGARLRPAFGPGAHLDRRAGSPAVALDGAPGDREQHLRVAAGER